MMRRIFLLFAMLWCLPATAASLSDLNLPDGFHIDVFAHVPGARSMAVADDLGVVFVGSRDQRVSAVVDANADGRAERVIRLFSDLKVPNGIAWRDGYLYVAEQHQVVRYRVGWKDKVGGNLSIGGEEVIFKGLPDQGWHGWRYAAFGPDGYLYVSVGAPCNICRISDPEGTILRLNVQTGKATVYARGIRNSVGLAFHPLDGSLFFTDNGADNMGDDLPPEELNRAPRAGLHFGYPYFGGGNARTAQFLNVTPPETVAPVQTFGAHVAPLGVHFFEGGNWPEAYRGNAYIAQHGSWNRSVPDGYRVVRVRFDGVKPTATQTFIDGWLDPDGNAWGRPVDIKTHTDGSMLVSDDAAGVIYRVRY